MGTFGIDLPTLYQNWCNFGRKCCLCRTPSLIVRGCLTFTVSHLILQKKNSVITCHILVLFSLLILQIIYMGWVDEKEQDSVQDRMYSPKFLALRGSSLFKFSAPPVSFFPLHPHLFYTSFSFKPSIFLCLRWCCSTSTGDFSFDVNVLLREKTLSCSEKKRKPLTHNHLCCIDDDH